MEFRIGATVLDRDGRHLGKLKHIILDPKTKSVVEIVVQEGGFSGRDPLIPVSAVTQASHDAVHLDLVHDRLDKFQAFSATGAPPSSESTEDWLFPGVVPAGLSPVGSMERTFVIGDSTPLVGTHPIADSDIDIRASYRGLGFGWAHWVSAGGYCRREQPYAYWARGRAGALVPSGHPSGRR